MYEGKILCVCVWGGGRFNSKIFFLPVSEWHYSANPGSFLKVSLLWIPYSLSVLYHDFFYFIALLKYFLNKDFFETLLFYME